MKKLAISLIYICLLFAIVGCGSKQDTNNEQTKNDNQVEETLNFNNTNKTEVVSKEDDAEEDETQSSPEIETLEMIYEVVGEETSLYSYVRKVKKVEGSTTKFDIKTTNYVYKENVEGEPQMLFTCYNDLEKATYQYFFLSYIHLGITAKSHF